ncbi:MAG TPA: sugar transferase [Stellaceae bacterium]|nr:sugar transferase [Stellaceae bacterium]
MSVPSPTSRSSLRIRYSLFDVALAALAPLLALSLRNAPVLNWSEQGLISAGGYCLLSLIFSLIAFSVFRIHTAIPRYLSIDDIVVVAKAVIVGEFFTCAVLFTVTRLDGIPRSTPAIHALVLGAGLIMARAFVYLIDNTPKAAAQPEEATNVILIGLNDLSVRFIELLQASARGRQNLIGVLDSKLRLNGRSVNGVRVFGPPAHLDALIEEFATHGVSADLVVVGSEAHELSKEAMSEVRRVCSRRNIELMFLSDVLNVSRAKHAHGAFQVARVVPLTLPVEPAVIPSRYFRSKRFVDLLVATILLIALSPLWLVVVMLAVFDVGTPVVFWQRRIGLQSREFQLYKFRTLRASFDWQGHKVPKVQRLSRIGKRLRKMRLDEIPQLLNVLLGDMSLIGPRPLLLQDQPPNPSVRLIVRPGITGWAQVNGGALLSAVEKDDLDTWYIRHASLWLDLRVLWMTLVSLARGDRRSEQALAVARSDRRTSSDLPGGTPAERAAAAPNPALKEHGPAPAVLSS